ncbi:MAG TPA: helix-turn-helix domain-containing protein [Nitrososphaerales archaeon]|nr:helix-turn-helix domain-containing protein [Nitrososphaerales archaeon]
MMVVEQDKKEALLEALGDDYARKILIATVSQAKSADEIARDNGIPVSTCYRRVHELLSVRLLRIEQTIISDSGKKYETFRSTVKDATINFSSNEISVEVTLISREPAEKLTSMWKSIRKENELLVVVG